MSRILLYFNAPPTATRWKIWSGIETVVFMAGFSAGSEPTTAYVGRDAMRSVYTRALVPRARELREDQTPAERRLWHGSLRALPLRVRRQCPMHGYIVDFYIHSYRLVIELDGTSHDTPEAQAYDAERTRILEAAGLRVVRFSNREVFGQFQAVCERIGELLQGDPPPASREPPLEGGL